MLCLSLKVCFNQFHQNPIKEPQVAAPLTNQEPAMNQQQAYQVIDNRTGQVVGTFKNKNAARNKRDRLDMAYGAVRYSVREVAA